MFIGNALLALLIHELGHYLIALYFGEQLAFRFELSKLFGKIPIPRFIWTMPEGLTNMQKKAVALAGFGTELTAIVPCVLMGFWEYAVVAGTHLVLYNWYAGENNDFKWLNA